MQHNYLGMVFVGLCWGFWKQQASGVNSTQRGQCPGTTRRVTQVPQDNTIQEDIFVLHLSATELLFFNCFRLQPLLLLLLILLRRPGARGPAQQVLPHRPQQKAAGKHPLAHFGQP